MIIIDAPVTGQTKMRGVQILGVSTPRGRASALAARSLTWIAGVLVLAMSGALVVAPALAAPPLCEMRIAVKLTPDVENPRDPAFLSGLLGNNAGYSLVYRRQSDDDASVELDLAGPGPQYLCETVVESIRKNGFVLGVDVVTKTS